jgi:alpha-amylase
MVDVVVNHNGYRGTPDDPPYDKFNPFNDASYYHPYCVINFDDISNLVSVEGLGIRY